MAAAESPEDVDWDQGSMLPAEDTVGTLMWAHPEVQVSANAKGAITARKRELAKRDKALDAPWPAPGAPKAGERAMVITQGCDIVKAADVMPQVEIARVFESTNPAVIAESQHYGSAHFYRLDKGTGVPATILDYGRRAHLDKGFLEALEPDNSILASWSVETRKTFARWLGRRYSRPAVPDEHYETITAPVVAMWRRLAVDDPARAAAYSAEYPEFRYRLDGDVLIVYVLSANAAPDETAWLELSGLIADALSPYHGTVEISSDRRSYHVFTKAEELASEQIDLDWASHDEGAVTGAIPG